MEFFDALICTTQKDEICTVSIWDSNNGTLVSRYRGGGFANFHGLTSSGGYILTCERAKPLIHVWSFNKQHPENKRLITPGKIHTIAFSPECVHIAVSISEKVHLYQACTGKLLGIASRHFQPVTVMKFTCDGNLLCCGGEDGLVTVWDVQVFSVKEKDPEPLFAFAEHGLPVTDLFVSVGINARLYSVSDDMTVKIFDLVTGEKLLSLVFYVKLSCVTLSPTETNIYIGTTDGGIHEFSLTSPPRTVEYHLQHDERNASFVEHEKSVTSLACMIDCEHLISGSLDESIKIWSIASRSCMRTIPQKGPVTNILYIPFLSKKVFGPDFRPKALIHDFVNPANVSEDEEPYIEVIHSQDLVCLENAAPVQAAVGTRMKKGNIEHSQEILKRTNHLLYKFAVEKILEKKPADPDILINKKKSKKRVRKD